MEIFLSWSQLAGQENSRGSVTNDVRQWESMNVREANIDFAIWTKQGPKMDKWKEQNRRFSLLSQTRKQTLGSNCVLPWIVCLSPTFVLLPLVLSSYSSPFYLLYYFNDIDLQPVDFLMHFGPHFAEITPQKPPLLKKKSILKEGGRDDSNNRKWW
jgi:hypothetical protein